MPQYHYRRIKKKPIYKKPLLWIVLIILVALSAIFFLYKNKQTDLVPVPVSKKEIKQDIETINTKVYNYDQ